MQCKSCHKESPIGAKFCGFCGETISAVVNQSEDFTPDYDIEIQQEPVVEPQSESEAAPQESVSASGKCTMCGQEDESLVVRGGELCCRGCLSSFGNRRIGAYILDYVSIWVSLYVFFFLGAYLVPGIFAGMTEESLNNFSKGVFIFCILFKDAFQGRSIGKRALGLAVLKIKTSQPAGPVESFLRNVPLFVPFVALFALTSLENESRLGEGWAGTKVVSLGIRATGKNPKKVGAKGVSKSYGPLIAGIVSSIFILSLLAAIAIPNLLRAKISANDALAKGKLRTLSTASETYATTNGGYYPVSVEDLTNANPPYITERYCDVTVYGFSYSCEFSKFGYKFVATPVTPGTSGTKTFTMQTGGVLE